MDMKIDMNRCASLVSSCWLPKDNQTAYSFCNSFSKTFSSFLKSLHLFFNMPLQFCFCTK